MPMFSADLPSIDIHKRDSTILKKKIKENSMEWILMCIVWCLLWKMNIKKQMNNKYRKISEVIFVHHIGGCNLYSIFHSSYKCENI